MAHVNSITRRERDGYYLYSDQGIKLGGPFASSYEADSLAEYLSDKLGERPVEEYQNLGSQMGPSEGRTTTIEGTPNPWGDLPTEREQEDFRKRTTGYPFGERDWRNILPNTIERFQGLFERDEDNLFEYNPKAELQEELKRTGLEEQYLQDTTRYRGPEPPEDRGWTMAPRNVMQPMSRVGGWKRNLGDVLGGGLLSMVSEAEAHPGTMTTLEKEDMIRDIFGKEGDLAVAIAKAESFPELRERQPGPKGEDSWGIFQINWDIWGPDVVSDDGSVGVGYRKVNRQLKLFLGRDWEKDDLKNPEANIRAAKIIRDLKGWGGWSQWMGYTEGGYKKHYNP